MLRFVYTYIQNKENQKGVNETKNKTLKRYSRPSSRGRRENWVRMTFLVSVRIKLKMQTCPRRHLRENEKMEMFYFWFRLLLFDFLCYFIFAILFCSILCNYIEKFWFQVF